MFKRQSLKIQGLYGFILALIVATQALAVWPPSTAFQEKTAASACGIVIMAFVIGLVLGIWVQRNHHEHK